MWLGVNKGMLYVVGDKQGHALKQVLFYVG